MSDLRSQRPGGDEAIQTRDSPGSAVRARRTTGDVFAAIEAAGLTPAERSQVLEAVEAADTSEARGGQLAGATFLTNLAASPNTPNRVGLVLRKAATAYIRPHR
jgi:hypothetical protein